MNSTIVFQIDATHIKCLRMTGGSKGIINFFDVVDISHLSDAEIVNRLITWVKLKKISFNAARVVLVLPRTLAILRQLTLPAQERSELRAMVDLQAINHMPYAREDVEIDFQIISKTTDGYSKVLTVILPRDAAVRYWQIFEQAHIPVHTMTISSIGLWLWYCRYQKSAGDLSAVIDLDVHHSEICFCLPQSWITSRDISCGVSQLNQDGPTEFLAQWVLTINSAIKEKLFSAVPTVYLLSSTGQTSALATELSRHVGVVKEINCLEGLPVAKNIQWSKALLTDGVSLAPLLGLATALGKSPINLIPESVQQQKIKDASRRQWIFLGVWGVLAVLMIGFALTIGTIKQATALGALEKEYKIAKKDAQKVEHQLQQLKQTQDLLRQRVIFMDVAQEIYRMLPAQTSLVSVFISDGRVLSMQGFSSKAGDINQMQADMVNSPFFTNVNLEYVNKRVTQDGEVNYFKLTGTIKKIVGSDEKTK